MSSIPSNLARVPNVLSSQVMLGALTRSASDVLEQQVQLTSGLRINRPSDDAIGASAVSVLDDLIERRTQRLRNLEHADSMLGNLDSAFGDLGNMLIEAKGVAQSQIGVGSDEATRRNQANIIDAMLLEAMNIANRKLQQVQLFGGDRSSGAPFSERLGGFQYHGSGEGLTVDTGLSSAMRVTVSGEDAFGALSSRVGGARDLDPTFADGDNTRLGDLNGARGLGISLGLINADINGTDVSVDLSSAHTVEDVVAALETAIQTVDAGAAVSIDAASGKCLRVEPSAGVTITISDLAAPATAADLGLDTSFVGGAVGNTGGDLDARITDRTLIARLTGVTGLGTLRLENMGQTRDVDLSGATTVQDLRNLVEATDLGIRVEISEDGDRLDFINELSGGRMSIGEVAGGDTATQLGVRSLIEDTELSLFNDGRGVRIRSGSVDPISGAPDPAKDLDFRISTKDGTDIDVDLAGAVTVQDVLDAINTAAAGAGAALTADLAADGNGIELTDATVGADPTEVTVLNGSGAAEDLGLLGSSTGATLTGEDRAKVAVDSVFSHLLELREALRSNDERGITFAAEKLETDISRNAERRAEVGVTARRVSDASQREEDLQIQDEGLRSQIRDLDFTSGALRFAQLQQQLQAGLATAARVSSLSLLDFLS